MNSPSVIGIAGGSGSGKTSVATKIIESIGRDRVLLLQHDWYYRDLPSHGSVAPDDINFDHPDSLETSLLVAHLKELRAGNEVQVPQYDFTTHRRRVGITVSPRDLIILDGILILADDILRKQIDLKVYVDTEADERLLRRIRRDMADRGRSLQSVIHQYASTVRPMHQQFVEPSKVWADIIIPEGGENVVAVDLVVQRIRSMIDDRS